MRLLILTLLCLYSCGLLALLWLIAQDWIDRSIDRVLAELEPEESGRGEP